MDGLPAPGKALETAFPPIFLFIVVVSLIAITTASCSSFFDGYVKLPKLPAGWSKIEPGGDTCCAHGTPYAFWVKPGRENRLLIYLQGGGACWDAASCAKDSYLYDPDVGEEDNPSLRGGIFEFENPDNPFRDYYVVFIPYCTADIHWGDKLATYSSADGEPFTIHYKGFVNTSAALDWVYQNFSAPESIFVTGCSAGSLGSILNSAYIINHYPDSIVSQLGDSLAGVFPKTYNFQDLVGAHANFPAWINELKNLQPGIFEISDFYIALANYYPENTFSQLNSAQDGIQQTYFAAQGGEPSAFEGGIEASLSKIHSEAANFRSYTLPDVQHCFLQYSLFYTTETGGMVLADWVSELAKTGSVASIKGKGVRVDLEQ